MIVSHNVLLIDADTEQQKQLSATLHNAGYQVRIATGSQDSLQTLRKLPIELVICDISLAGEDGFKLHEQIHREYPNLSIMLIVSKAYLPEAIEATAKGCFGFISAPFESTYLLDTVRAALDTTRIRQDQRWRNDVLGKSATIENLLDQARRVSASDAPIIISGPSGTGKKLLGMAIHKASPRSNAPCEIINCSELSAQALETELFGFRHSAFSGSKTDRVGFLQKAQGGTLILEEISEMAKPLQTKLLKVLQANSMKSLDGQSQVPVNVRIIATTCRNLEHTMFSGEFDDSLFYHLSQATLEVPPLHERPEDIPLLARHFLQMAARKNHRRVKNLSAGAIHLLGQAAWPGNISQLREVVEEVVAESPSAVVPESLVEEALSNQEKIIPSFNDARAEFERHYLIKLLKITEGNVTHAARIAQRNRTDLYKLLGKYDLEPAKFKVSRSRKRTTRTAQDEVYSRSGTEG